MGLSCGQKIGRDPWDWSSLTLIQTRLHPIPLLPICLPAFLPLPLLMPTLLLLLSSAPLLLVP